MSKQRSKNFTKDKPKQIKQMIKSEDAKFKTISHVNGFSKRIVTILPPISPNSPFTIKRRYIASGAVTGNILISDLFNTWVVASTATLGHPIARAMRLKKISFLSPVTTQGTSVLLQVTPNAVESTSNNFNTMPESYIDTSASIDKPAFISLKPSEITPFGSWHVTQETATGQMLGLLCVSGTIMDITIEVIPNNNSTVVYSVVLTGATAGVSYAKAILTNFTPIGFPSA